MSNRSYLSSNVFSGRNLYLLLALIASFPIFMATNSYVNSINVHNDEAVSVAATLCFMTGIFIGRYFARLWTLKSKSIPNSYLVILTVIIVVSVSWLFFHADFPLEGRNAINLLLFWLPFVTISLALGALIKLVRTVSRIQLKEAQESAARSKSELHLLQSQLSPHFLFNTLNNLYGLSLTQHEKLPPLLLRLSQLLRFSVYDANEMYVPLKDEIEYISNYIEFEKIRVGDRLVLNVDLEKVVNTETRIAPMLLMVFIENAFKHSKNTAESQVFIDITLKTWGNSVLFSVRNSYSNEGEDKSILEKNSGFGLASVSKRLELLYHNEFELNVQKDEAFYTVMLQLKMKK